MYKNARVISLIPDGPGKGGLKTGVHTHVPNTDVRDVANVYLYNARWRKANALAATGATPDTDSNPITPLVLHNYPVYSTIPGASSVNHLLGHNHISTGNNRLWEYTSGGVNFKETTNACTPAVFLNIKNRCFVCWGGTNNFIIDLTGGTAPTIYDVGVAGPPTAPVGYTLYGVAAGASAGTCAVVNGSSWITQDAGSTPSWDTIDDPSGYTIVIGGVNYTVASGGVKTTGWTTPGTISTTNNTPAATVSGLWPFDGSYCGLTIHTAGGHDYVVGSYTQTGSTTHVQFRSNAVASEPNVAYTIPAGSGSNTNKQIQLTAVYGGTTAWSQTYSLNQGSAGISWGDKGPTYAYAYYDPSTGHISNVSPLLSVTEQHQSSLYGIHFPAGSFATMGAAAGRFTRIVIFRTLFDGGAVLFPIADDSGDFSTAVTIDNTTVISDAWDDIFPDSSLITSGGFTAPYVTNNPPLPFQHQAYWDGRVWGNPVSDQTAINFSADSNQVPLGVPEESYPSNNLLRIPAADGRVCGMHVVGEYLIITTNRFTYYVAGNNETNYRIVKFSSTMFGVGDYQMMEFAGEVDSSDPTIVYLGSDWRIYSYSPASGNIQLSQPIQNIPDTFSSIGTQLQNVRMQQVISKGARWLVFCFASGAAGLYDLYALDYENKVWLQFRYPELVENPSTVLPMTVIYSSPSAPVYPMAVTPLPISGTYSVYIYWLRVTTLQSRDNPGAYVRTGPKDFDRTSRKRLHEVRVFVSGLTDAQLLTYPWGIAVYIDDGKTIITDWLVRPADQAQAISPAGSYPVDSATTAELVWTPEKPCWGYRFDVYILFPAYYSTELDLDKIDLIVSDEQEPDSAAP